MANRSASGDTAQRGFTYLGVLFAVALMSIGLLAVSEVWTKTAERQKVAQLEWIGQQYVQAIESYYYANTGSVHYYPPSLDDLLEDKRYLSIRRHLRVVYPDPFTGAVSWKLIAAPQGGIMGVAFEPAEAGTISARTFVFKPAATQR